MNRRARRAIWAVAIALVVLIVTVAGGVTWLLNTQEGARWGFERLGAILPGKLDVEDMRGPIRGPLEIHKLTYRTDIAEVTIDTLSLDWRLRDLWRRRLVIRSVHAGNVRWLLGKPGEHKGARDSLASPLPDVDLPVAILIEKGSVSHLQITPSERDTGLLIDRVTLDASSLKDGLHVKQLVVHSVPINLEFQGKLTPRGSYPLALKGRWAYQPANGLPLSGEGIVEGTLDTLHVRQEMARPFVGRLDATFYRPRAKMHFVANLQFTRLEPQTIQAGLPAGVFRGWMRAQGDVDRFTGQGSLAGTSAMTGPARADFTMERQDSTIRLRDFRMTLPRTGTALHATGTVTMDSIAPRFQLASDWRNLEWPLQGSATPMARSARGSARLDGSMRDFGVRLEALIAGPRMPPGRWTLDGRGGNGRLAIRTVVANLLGGRITGTGDVAWAPRVTWNLRFDGRSIDPGQAWGAWPGNLAFTGLSQGAMAPGGPSGRILISRLGGSLRRQPISGGGTLTARNGQYALSGAGVQWGPNAIAANGTFGRQWGLTWSVNAPALATILPGGSGSLHGQGSVRGATAQLHIVATLRGDSLFFGQTHAGALRADADLDLRPRGPVSLTVAAFQVDLNQKQAQRILLSARGTRERHQVRAAVTGRVDSLVAVATGGFAAHGWRGALQALDLVNRTTGRWALQAPAPIELASDRMRVSNLAWGSGPSRVTLTADWTRAGPWHLDANLQQMQLSLLGPLLPDELRIQGPLAGHVRAHADGGGRVFCDADLVPGPGQLSYQDPSGKWVPTRFDHGMLRVNADGRQLTGTLRTDLVNVGTVRADLRLPAYSRAVVPERQPLDGRLQLHLRDLAIAQGFSRDLSATSGQLDADLALGGTVAHPTVRGPFHLRNGAASVARLGVDLREVNLDANGSSNGTLALQGSLRSGGGVLRVAGNAALGSKGLPVARVDITGDRVLAMHTKEMNFVVSPDLHLRLAGRRADVTGQIAIPEGMIEMERNQKRIVVKSSPDLVYSGTDTVGRGPVQLHSQVRIVIGDKVTFRGYGLDMRPAGSVLVTDEPGLPALGTGELTVRDGRYRIYGQELTIESARLIFGGGPLSNPAIRARAVRKAGDVTAGFQIAGTVQKPDVHVFSDPAMAESQALSYIMFGKPLDRGTLSQGQLMSTMATTMGVAGSNQVAHGVASRAGIEQAKIEAGDSFKNAALSLGTHLSPRLYVTYGVGLFETVAALRLRYLVNTHLTLEAESAQQNRVDLMYTVER